MIVGDPSAIGDPHRRVHFSCPGCAKPFEPSKLYWHIMANRTHVGPDVKMLLFSTCQLDKSSGARSVYVSEMCGNLKSDSKSSNASLSFLGDQTVPQGMPTPLRRIYRHGSSPADTGDVNPPCMEEKFALQANQSGPLQQTAMGSLLVSSAGGTTGRKRKKPETYTPAHDSLRRQSTGKSSSSGERASHGYSSMKTELSRLREADKVQQQKNAAYDKEVAESKANRAEQGMINKKQDSTHKMFGQLFAIMAKHVDLDTTGHGLVLL